MCTHGCPADEVVGLRVLDQPPELAEEGWHTRAHLGDCMHASAFLPSCCAAGAAATTTDLLHFFGGSPRREFPRTPRRRLLLLPQL